MKIIIYTIKGWKSLCENNGTGAHIIVCQQPIEVDSSFCYVV